MKKIWKNFVGFLFLLAAVTAVTSVTIVIYTLIDEKSNHNIALISLLIFVDILFFTFVFFYH